MHSLAILEPIFFKHDNAAYFFQAPYILLIFIQA